ncbi:MAG: hypothetical protein EBV05_02185 [Cyanobacteria bacterium WB6_1B_304]|nr:hypothetical protein [Cyanobacteria bacterium WB6_1B_304]
MTKPEGSAEAEKEEDSREEPIPIEICRGYSRDRLKVASGNRHDSEMFAQVLKDFSEQWTQEGVFVMDASFYTQPDLKQVGSLG